MFTTTKLALAAIVFFGVSSAALANDREDSGASVAQIDREAAEAKNLSRMGQAGTANAYFVSPTEQDTRKKGHSR